MKLALCVLAAASTLAAQERSTYTTVTTDVNGNRVAGPTVSQSKSSNAFERTERLESLNGRLVPREQVEERVLREDASGKTVERIVRRFDPTGQPGPPEKIVIEEQKQGNSVTTRTTTYRGDLNGRLQLTERSVSEKHQTGASESTQVSVERPTLNGGLETVEKRSIEKTQAPGGNYQENSTTYRSGASGMYLALKLVASHTETNGQKVDNVADYEIGSSGTLTLHGQTVTHTTTRPDGSQVAEVDRFSTQVPGFAAGAQAQLKLLERQYVETKKGSGGTVETVTVQRPSISDPNVLGPAKVIAEKVCRGKCD